MAKIDLDQMTSDTATRVAHFLGTTPSDAQNRRRLVFFLIAVFVCGIVVEIYRNDEQSIELIKNLTSTITWLVGIYIGGSVAAKIAGEAPTNEQDTTHKSPNAADQNKPAPNAPTK